MPSTNPPAKTPQNQGSTGLTDGVAFPPIGLVDWGTSGPMRGARHLVVVESPNKRRLIQNNVNGYVRRLVDENDRVRLDRLARQELAPDELSAGDPVETIQREISSGEQRYSVVATVGHFKSLFKYTPQDRRPSPTVPSWALPFGYARWDEEQKQALQAAYEHFLTTHPERPGDDPLRPETNPGRFLAIEVENGYRPWHMVENMMTLTMLGDTAFAMLARALGTLGLGLAPTVAATIRGWSRRKLKGIVDQIEPDPVDQSTLEAVLTAAQAGTAAAAKKLGGNLLYSLAAVTGEFGDWTWDPHRPVGTVYLATDPDREGELIAAHVQNEMTAFAANNGFALRFLRMRYTALGFFDLGRALLGEDEDGGRVNQELGRPLVSAASVRETLDRLIGYPVSRALRGLNMGLTISSEEGEKRAPVSAGRVQIAALEMLMREDESALMRFPSVRHTFHATAAVDGTALTLNGSTTGEVPDLTRLVRDVAAAPGRVKGMAVHEGADAVEYWPEPFLTAADYQDTLHGYRGVPWEAPWYEVTAAARLTLPPFRRYLLTGSSTEVMAITPADQGAYITIKNGTPGPVKFVGEAFGLTPAKRTLAPGAELRLAVEDGVWVASKAPEARIKAPNAKAAMDAAQTLFQFGQISYPRTDSRQLSRAGYSEMQSLGAAAGLALTGGQRHFAKREGAQEAHEAIRPKAPDSVDLTEVLRLPTFDERRSLAWMWAHYVRRLLEGEDLPEFALFAAEDGLLPAYTPMAMPNRIAYYFPVQLRAFDLIARRTLAALMGPARTHRRTIDVEHPALLSRGPDGVSTPVPLSAVSETYVELGFHGIWRRRDYTKSDAKVSGVPVPLPVLRPGAALPMLLNPDIEIAVENPRRPRSQNLVRRLDKAQIGRPSTIGAMLETLEKRGYVLPNQGGMSRFGALVTSIIREGMGHAVDLQTTELMEAALNGIVDLGGRVGVKGAPDDPETRRALQQALRNEKQAILDRFYLGVGESDGFLARLERLREMCAAFQKIRTRLPLRGAGFADGRQLRGCLVGVLGVRAAIDAELLAVLRDDDRTALDAPDGGWEPRASVCLARHVGVGQLQAVWRADAHKKNDPPNYHARLWQIYRTPTGAPMVMVLGTITSDFNALLDRVGVFHDIGEKWAGAGGDYPVHDWLGAWDTVFQADADGNAALRITDFLNYDTTFATLQIRDVHPESVPGLLGHRPTEPEGS